jgi:fucose permease
MPASRSRFSLLLLVTFLAFISIGFPDAALGVAWPSMRVTFDRDRADLGFILFASGAGYFTSGVFAGKAIHLLGVGRLLAASTTAVSIGLFGYALSPSFWLLLIVAALIGFGSGAVDAGLNFYAAEHFSVTVMNWMHAFFGIGAMLGPFIMAGVLAADGSWRIGYLIVAGVTFAMALTFALTAKRWTDGEHHDAGSRPEPAPMSDVLRQPLVWLQVAIFFIMAGIEASAGSWTATIMLERFGASPAEAGLWGGLFWGAMAVGRLVLAPLSGDLRPARLIQLGTIGLVIGGLMMTPDRQWLFQSGLLIFGLSMAPLFPTMMSLTPARLGTSVAIHAIGFQVSAATLGVAAIPTLSGVIAGRTSLAAIPWVIAVGAVILIVLETLLRSRADRRVPATTPIHSTA